MFHFAIFVFYRSYKTRHQLVCPAGSSNLMLPMVPVHEAVAAENQPDQFKSLLNTLQLDEIGQYLKTDPIILMIGLRSFAALKRKKDKITETRKSVRARMRLVARLYLVYRDLYGKQSNTSIANPLGNVADMYRRETITILGAAIDQLCDKGGETGQNSKSITDQKSGLKINILNVLKLSGKFLIGHFLIKNQESRSKDVTNFLQVLDLLKNELFGDAYYELNYRKNVATKKPSTLPSER